MTYFNFLVLYDRPLTNPVTNEQMSHQFSTTSIARARGIARNIAGSDKDMTLYVEICAILVPVDSIEILIKQEDY